MKKINFNLGIVIFFIMTFLSAISFYFFRMLAFAAQGGSGFSVKLFFNLLLFVVEFMGALGLLSPIVGLINDKVSKLNISWKVLILISILLTFFVLALTKGPIGI